VALQRKGVKPIGLAGLIGFAPKCLQRAKESPSRRGARGVQTLYMTGRMQINQKARLPAILQALD
jgi:hypothetical protein